MRTGFTERISMAPISPARGLAVACSAAMLLALVACGGGSAGAPPASVAPSGVIRYEVSYAPDGTLPGSTVQAHYLTVRPLSGSTTMGTRATSSVQVTVGQETPRTLTAPTYVDAQGRPNYVFTIDPSYAYTTHAGLCPANLPLSITVTDTAGLSFTSQELVCPGQSQTVDALSDYGDQVATFTAWGPPGVTQARFSRGAPPPMLDATASTPPDGSVTWTLKVASGDQLASYVSMTQDAPDGAAATARVELEGGAYAQAIAGKADPGYTDLEGAVLLCCGGAPDASAPTQTVSFAVEPQLIAYSTSTTVPVSVQYRIVDGVTGQTRVDSSATLDLANQVDTAWTFQVRQGDRMFLQASSPTPSTRLWGSIEIASTGSNLPRIFGQAATTVPGMPATVNVVVPAAQ
jgi:hypothetical protein